MKEYSLGFIFNHDKSQVLLIKKNRPVEQAGLYNGIGGKRESSDFSIEHCFLREVQEEAGINLTTQPVYNIGSYGDNQYYKIGIFTTCLEDVLFNSFQSLTDEKIEIHNVSDLNGLQFTEGTKDLIDDCLRFHNGG